VYIRNMNHFTVGSNRLWQLKADIGVWLPVRSMWSF
jgi:hypothetical protein